MNRVAAAIQVLTLIGSDEAWADSLFIAGFSGLDAAVIRRLIGRLAGAGLVVVRRGNNGGARLKKPPAVITLAEVFDAVDGEELIGLRRSDLQRTVEGRVIAPLFAEAAEEAVSAYRLRLAATTLEDVITICTEARRQLFTANRLRAP